MLRYLGIGLLVLVIGGAAFYVFQVNRIENRIDELAGQVGMFGRLEHDGVSLRPGGRIRIHDVAFYPRGMNESISVSKIVLQGESLLSMLNLGKRLENGEIPNRLGISLNGIVLPVDGQLFELLTQQQGGFNSGILFEAAGCGDRQRFDARDLTGMDYWDLLGDVDLSYEMSRDNRRVDVNLTMGLREMSRNHVDAELAISGGGPNLQSMVGAEVELETASLTYEDLGFYERMINYCADQTDRSPADYRSHHLQAWESSWSTMGLDPGEEAVAAYTAFVESPGEMRLSIDPAGSVQPAQLRGLSPYLMAQRLGLRIDVNGEDFGALSVSRTDPDEADGPSGSDSTDDGKTGAALPWQSSSGDDAGENQATQSQDSDGAASGQDDGYERVSVSALPRLTGRWVELRMANGDEKTGRIVEVDGNRVRLEQRLSGGYAIVPVNQGEIREVRVIR